MLRTAFVCLVCLSTQVEAQIARQGATRLNARTVVLTVLHDTLDGVHLDAQLRPDGKANWRYVYARYDPASVSPWVTAAERLLGGADGQVPATGTDRTPLLAGLGGTRGLEIVHAPSEGAAPARFYWLFHCLGEDPPIAIVADRDFSRAAVRALGEAARWSAIDRSAFLTALVPPLSQLEASDTLDPAPRHIPTPEYPRVLQRKGTDGLVLVRFVIDSSGRADMDTFETLWASHEAFVPSVRTAIFRGRFRAARYEGRSVHRRVYQTVRFVAGRDEGIWQ